MTKAKLWTELSEEMSWQSLPLISNHSLCNMVCSSNHTGYILYSDFSSPGSK
eukprot:c46969_g1_i1 orf=70-225(+)